MALWTNRYNPGNIRNYARALALDNNGRVFVTGSTGDGDIGDDFSTIAYSTSGGPLWTNRYNGSANLDDAVFVTGVSRNDPTSLDIATVAYSNSGEPLWENRYMQRENAWYPMLVTWCCST